MHNKRDAASVRDKVIQMIIKSGFQEKDFIIKIDRGAMPAKVETVEEKTLRQPAKLQRRKKTAKVVTNKTRKREGRKK
jgi:hypothetical protein